MYAAMYDVSTVFVSVASVLFVYYVYGTIKWWKNAKILNRLPGPRYFPIVGTMYEIWGGRDVFVEKVYKQHGKYGSLYRTWVGSSPVVQILKPEHAEVVLKSAVNVNKGMIYKFIKPWLGEGLLVSSREQWHARRKLLTPAFHFKVLEDFFEVFVEKGEKLVEVLGRSGEFFDVFRVVKLCGLDIICKTAMGCDLRAMEGEGCEYVTAVEEMTDKIVHRFIKPWFHNDFIFRHSNFGRMHDENLKILHEFTEKVIRNRKKTGPNHVPAESPKKRRLAFLDLLLEASEGGKVLSDEAIRDEVDTFMFAGHDTTTIAVSWALFLLGNNPQQQSELSRELSEVFDPPDRPITMDDLKNLPYLDMVLKETLRLYPSAPSISRTLSTPITLDDYSIPAGTSVKIHIDRIHRDPAHYPDPDVFNPQNFHPNTQRHPFAFVPFSAGPRNCIGQKFAMLEAKVLLASVLRKYQVLALHKPEDVKVYHELILRPQNGIFIKFIPKY